MRVVRTPGTVSLSHSFWTLDLPAAWVEGVPGLTAVLERKASVHDLSAREPELRNLLALLEAQGCLSYPDDRDLYSLREVRELFEHLSAGWYGRYYAHPLWARLREGSLSTNAFLAWLLHTYHLSRSVGMSASRSATHLPSGRLRTLFAQSALEEYAHCEDHFFVRYPGLPIDDRRVRRSVQSPSGLAFDQQMLRMAEEDWLGHVLAALFQEASSRFGEDARSFYRTVERVYDVPGLFGSWERHIDIDLEEGHADDFSRVLESNEPWPADDVRRALHGAWLTFQFLVGALDDVLAEDRPDEGVLLRLPVSGRLDPARTALLAPYRDVLTGAPSASAAAAGDLADRLCEIGLAALPPGHPRSRTRPDQDVEFLRVDLTASLFRAMSFCTEHEEVLTLGRLAEEAVSLVATVEAHPLESRRRPLSPFAMALANVFREAASHPKTVAFLLLHAWLLESSTPDWTTTWLPLSTRGVDLLRTFLRRWEIGSAEADRLATEALRLGEIFGRWVALADRAEPVDFFRD